MKEHIRSSVIAGSWYPGNRKELEKTIASYFSKVKNPEISGEIAGLISPHAGYVYSGFTAAHGYHLIAGKQFDVVVVISPMHRMAPGRYVVNHADWYETPLGRIKTDRGTLEQLKRRLDIKTIPYDDEHSLEIQLPFLQYALQDFLLLPIMVGFTDVTMCGDLAGVLSDVLKGKKSLVVASSDLHHMDNYNEVVKKDRSIAKTLSGFDLIKIKEKLNVFDCSVCGRIPIAVLIETTQKMGAKKLEILHQTNSGDVTGEKTPGQYTVGYLSAAILK